MLFGRQFSILRAFWYPDFPLSLSEEVVLELKDTGEVIKRKKGAEKTQKIDNGIFSQQYVVEKGAENWKQVGKYGLRLSLLTPREMGIIVIACGIPSKIPSEKQSDVLKQIENTVRQEGFFLEGE